MELKGKIIQVLPAQSGVSQKSGNAWMIQSYILETDGKYPKKVPFEVFGEDKIKQFDIQLGDELTIQFDIEGSEWNGKWFTRVKCYAVQKNDIFSQKPAPEPMAVIYPDKTPSPQVEPKQEESDDLPF